MGKEQFGFSTRVVVGTVQLANHEFFSTSSAEFSRSENSADFHIDKINKYYIIKNGSTKNLERFFFGKKNFNKQRTRRKSCLFFTDYFVN